MPEDGELPVGGNKSKRKELARNAVRRCIEILLLILQYFM